jgi:hypothetical protein
MAKWWYSFTNYMEEVVRFIFWPLYSREIASTTLWLKGWLGCRASLNVVVKKEILVPARNQSMDI